MTMIESSLGRGSLKFTALLVLILGVQIATLWNSPFRLDDVRQIPAAQTKLMEEIRMVDPPESEFDAIDRNRFRPLLWTYYLSLNSISGVPYQPRLYYMSGVFLHLLVSVLSWKLLILAGCNRGGAWIFLAMALANPSGIQAVYWIAAHTDVIMALLALVSLLVRYHGWAVSGGVLCGLLVLCKSTAPALICVTMACHHAVRGGFDKREWLRWLCGLAMTGIPGWVWRSVYIGTIWPTRPNAVEASLQDTSSVAVSAGAHGLLDMTTAGLSQYLPLSRDHVIMASCGILIALISLVIMRRRSGSFSQILWGASAIAGSMAPFAFGFNQYSDVGHTLGRMLYLPYLLWAGFACLWTPARVHGILLLIGEI